MQKIDLAIKGLDEKERAELRSFLGSEPEVEIFEYIQKAAGLEEVVKIFFTDFHFFEWVRDAVLWELFERTALKTWDFVGQKKPNAKKEGVVQSQNITIIFPNDSADLKAMLAELPAFIGSLSRDDQDHITLTFDLQKKKIEVKIVRF